MVAIDNAGGGTRTPKGVSPPAPKAGAYANFATPANANAILGRRVVGSSGDSRQCRVRARRGPERPIAPPSHHSRRTAAHTWFTQ